MAAGELQALYEFVQQHTGRPVDSLAPATRLEGDLGLYGDDAFDFIRDFSQRFGVDLRGFDIGRHVRPEGDALSTWVLDRLLRRRRTDLTLGALAEAMARGRLGSPG